MQGESHDEMEKLKITVEGACAYAVPLGVITTGMVGAKCTFSFDAVWDGLHKTAVFRAGSFTRDVVMDSDTVEIPWEVLKKQNTLIVGVYGWNDEGIVIPTVSVPACRIAPGTTPSGDLSTNPQLPVWQQVLTMIGSLSSLSTEDKSSLVAAINELAAGDAGEIDPDQVEQLVREYLAANPPTVTETDPTVPDWAKQPQKPSYTAEEIGALSQSDLQSGVDKALAQAKESGEFDGPQGEQGPIGPQGPAGANGAAGATPEFSIGTVETLAAGSNATASIGGTAEKPVLNLGIPKGEPGEGGGTDGNYIPVPDVAEVGQTIVVTAVDANGVPTAWEAADLPSEGDNVVADTTVLYDSGQITIPAGTTKIVLPILMDDLAQYKEFYISCGVVAEPWKTLTYTIQYVPYVGAIGQAIVAPLGADAQYVVVFNRVAQDEDFFRIDGYRRGNGNYLRIPPQASNTYEFPKAQVGFGYWDAREITVSELFVSIPSQTEDVNLRFVVGGVGAYGTL